MSLRHIGLEQTVGGDQSQLRVVCVQMNVKSAAQDQQRTKQTTTG